MRKVLVIAGPTGVGKTSLSIELAKQLNAEIISGDSIQIYRGFDIGSGKISEAEKEGIVHYGINLLEASESWSVYDFQQYARRQIEEISSRGKLPMIVGGTGLYLKACLYDYHFQTETSETRDWSGYDDRQLYEMLKAADPKSCEKIHPNNRRRIERALTIAELHGSSMSSQIEQQKHELLYDALIIGLTMPREQLYQNIDMRVDGMVESGLETEIRTLLKQGVSFDSQPMRGIGYKEWNAFFEEDASAEEAINKIKTHSHQFAKRQYTWFYHQLNVEWFEKDKHQEMNECIQTWLKG